MTTAAQYLLALSTLPSGTAGQHLLAIQLGTGTGTGQTIYCSQTTAIIEQESITVLRKPKRQPASEATQPRYEAPGLQDHNVVVTGRPVLVFATYAEDEVTVLKTTNRTHVGMLSQQKTVTRKPRAIR